MPRLTVVDPNSDTGPGADILNGPLKDKQINIFKGIANNPGVLKAFLNFMGGAKAGALTDADHEVVALVTARNRKCDYCTAAHTQIAIGAGISEDQSEAIRRGKGADDRQQAIIDFTEAILDTNGFVSDEQLSAFKGAGFDDAAVIEVIAAITVNTFTNLFNHVNETVVDFPEPAAV